MTIFWLHLPLLLVIATHLFAESNALGTMAIDLGNEFMKVAIVKSGIPMEIALNKESKRKTASIVSIRGQERFFGSSAESIAVKYPAHAYHFIPSLLGKNMDHPSVKSFLERFPFYHLAYDQELSQLVFKQNNETVFTVEELAAMILQNAKDIAESYAGERIKSAVITVPSYFAQAERRALLRAANLANVAVDQLINQDTAVALHFGVFRISSFNATPQHYMFFNMGSQSSSACIVRYELVKEGFSDNTPQLTVLGLGADPSLGITEFAMRMRDHLAKEFQKQHKLDVFKDHRAMMKLLKEARRVVTILSANSETIAQVEFLMSERDLKVKVTRAELETLCADLFDRVRPLLDQALEAAQIPLADIREVILMGGGTRVPKVQDSLMAASGKTELGRSINSDEAAAMGAVYQAAFHSPGFRVKRFLVRDFNFFPFRAFYQTQEDKQVALYSRGNPYPQKRGLSISKWAEDIDVFVNYDQLDQPFATDLFPKGHSNFTHIRVVNVSEAISGALSNDSRMKGFKLHFDMDYSGILALTRVDARLEENPHLAANKSTLKSIGDTISGLFSGSSDDNGASEEQKEAPKETTNTANATVPDNSTTTAAPTPTNQIISIAVDFSVDYVDVATPSADVMQASRKKLQEMREFERQLLALEKSRNELESYIFNTRDRMEIAPFVDFSAPKDREEIGKQLQLVSDWYEEQGAGTTLEEYERQLETIRALVNPVDSRIKEHRERPEHFDRHSTALDTAAKFHRLVQELVGEPLMDKLFSNLTMDFGVFPFDRHLEHLNEIVRDKLSKAFTEADLDEFKELIEQQRAWHNESRQLAEKQPKHEDAVVKVSDIVDKHGNLVRQMTSLQDKYDSNRRIIRLEVQKWIRAKRNEMREEAEAEAKNKTANANATVTEAPEGAQKEETESVTETPSADADEKPAEDETSTPRSDL